MIKQVQIKKPFRKTSGKAQHGKCRAVEQPLKVNFTCGSPFASKLNFSNSKLHKQD